MRLFLGAEISFDSEYPFGKLNRIFNKELENFTEADPLDDAYGSEFTNIAIITTILGKDLKGMWKERRLVRHKKKTADIRLEIDYDRFVYSDEHTQMLLYAKNIIDSIMAVEERKKGDFNGKKLIDDILSALDLTLEDINI